MKKIVFLHIPKTGGTSVHNFLVQQFPKNKVCPDRFNTLKNHTKTELDKYLYFSGHYDMEGVEHISGDKDVFTFFREPKDTIMSLYYFWKSHKSSAIKNNNLVGPRLAKSMGLLDFIRSNKGPIPGNINNYTTRVLIGKMHCGPNGEFSYPKDELFDRAKERIDSLKTFGVMNHYDESYKLVLGQLGFTPPDIIPHSRNSKKNIDPNIEPVTKEEITSEILEGLTDLTEFDQRIYEYAQQRYQQLKMK
jgi:hypothetical protein